jgi:hypothetical protein
VRQGNSIILLCGSRLAQFLFYRRTWFNPAPCSQQKQDIIVRWGDGQWHGHGHSGSAQSVAQPSPAHLLRWPWRMPATQCPGLDSRRATPVAQPLCMACGPSLEPGSLVLGRPSCTSTRRPLAASCMQPSAQLLGEKQPSGFRSFWAGRVGFPCQFSPGFSLSLRLVFAEPLRLSLCPHSVRGLRRSFSVCFFLSLLRPGNSSAAGWRGKKTPK